MGAPVAVMGDQITGTCIGHQIAGPPTGNPVPAPPLPFSAPVTVGVATRTLAAGKPIVVLGASGLCTPPQAPLHATDPFQPPMQQGTVVAASATVLVEGKGIATAASQCTICFGLPGTLVATAATVLAG